MSEKTSNTHQELKQNRHKLVTIIGMIVWIVLGLVQRDDLLFGLVMGTIFGSGMNLGGHIATQISANAPAEHMEYAKVIGSIVAAAIVGIITALILTLIQGAVDVRPMEGDDIIASIVKLFFDSGASLAVGTGVLAGAITRGMASD